VGYELNVGVSCAYVLVGGVLVGVVVAPPVDISVGRRGTN